MFVDYLLGVEMLVARRAALIAAREQVIPDSRHAATIARLRCFRGIDTLSGAGLCAEVGDWHRFRPKQLSGFLGIVPTEHTHLRSKAPARTRSPRPARSTPAGCWSRLPITTVTAPPSARAWPAVKPARTRARSRSPGAPSDACMSAGILRLQRRKPAGVVAIACARELAAFCWEAATLT